MMRVRVSLKPGQPGTKGLLARYGKRLVCVRYRYDEGTKQRVKTVELIVGRSSWQPAPQQPDAGRRPARSPAGASPKLDAVRVDWHESGLRRKVKAAGGKWDPVGRVWRLDRDDVEDLGLEGRMVDGAL